MEANPTATRKTALLVGAAILGVAILGLTIGFGRVIGNRILSGWDAHAGGGGTANSNGRMIAVTGEYGNGTSVLWLIDTDTKRISVYRSWNGQSIQWIAARNAEWDFKVEGYHDESTLSAEELRRRWEQHALKRPVDEPERPEAESEAARLKKGREATTPTKPPGGR